MTEHVIEVIEVSLKYVIEVIKACVSCMDLTSHLIHV